MNAAKSYKDVLARRHIAPLPSPRSTTPAMMELTSTRCLVVSPDGLVGERGRA